MKPQEVEKIRQLDPNQCNGTFASVLLNPNINQASYPEVLYYLLYKTLEEKGYLEHANTTMTNLLVSKGMVHELNKCLELEGRL